MGAAVSPGMDHFATTMAETLHQWKQPGSGVQIGLTMGGPFTTAVAIYYPLCLYVAKAVREKRLSVPAGPLKFLTFCYNALAGALSVYGFYLMWQDPTVTDQLRTGPVFYAEKDFLPSTRLAINVFCATKCFEFFDTFLHSALKGHDPSFLHAFHHIVTGVCSWYAMATGCHFQHNPVAMNLIVHAIMFNYFALVAVHPTIKAMLSFTRVLITGIQLVQMVAGTYNQWFTVAHAGEGGYTHSFSQWYVAYYGLAMYAVYILIFGNFFCEQYVFQKVDTLTRLNQEYAAAERAGIDNLNDLTAKIEAAKLRKAKKTK